MDGASCEDRKFTDQGASHVNSEENGGHLARLDYREESAAGRDDQKGQEGLRQEDGQC